MTDRITVDDLRKVTLCVKGLRRYFNERGLDFKDFVKNGMTVEDAMLHGDEAFIRRVIEMKGQGDGEQ
ncbi:hypothetical protein IQ03_02457 [Gemmobacter caeni]|uniref:Uncharacterized protein n=1 Tax=Gemmobacter caeni TaxID=589035 RepID=A0A2T6AZ42_9RHOB|nr:hypothetical protein [Gemmobacter caeni]PTX49068.1 hypothetical protein C8N34_108178 [Gemmobacter caeni]TWI98931.1 hypothetical protein IQ03_02457 [Gemmobacter caeni]